MTTLLSQCLRPAALCALTLFALLALGPMEARAQWPTFDVLNKVGQAKQYAKMVQEYRKLKAQYEIIKRNAQVLSDPTFWDGFAEVRSVEGAMSRINTLGYRIENIERALDETFPGNTAYEDFMGESGTQFEHAFGTLRSGLSSLSRHGERIQDAVTVLGRLKTQNMAAGGALEAQQTQTNALLYQAQSIQMLRQELATMANMMAVKDAYDMNRRRQQDATRLHRTREAASADFPEVKSRDYGTLGGQ